MSEELILEEGCTYVLKDDTCENFFLGTSLYNRRGCRRLVRNEGFTLDVVEEMKGG